MRRLLVAVLLLLVGTVALLFAAAREPAVPGPGGFDLVAFFEGASVSRGTITTLLVSREDFAARFAGESRADVFRLEERFSFADGDRLQVWTLRRTPDGFAGTVETERGDGRLAPPVPVLGTADGHGVTLTYDGFAPGGGERVFGFRHHMRLADDGTVANHVVVSFHGLPLATSSVRFAKDAAALSSLDRER